MKRRRKPKPTRPRPVRRGFPCPKCQTGTNVLYSRHKPTFVLRRHECPKCGERFTTHQKIVNRASAPCSVDRPAAGLCMRDFLALFNLTPRDLGGDVTLTPSESADVRRNADRAS